jgi:hypothetical protein
LSNAEIERLNAYYQRWLNTNDPLKSVTKKQHGKPLVEDGVGTTEGTCNICSKKDCIYPISGIHLCPNCMKGGDWSYGMIKVEKQGKCAICGCTYEVGVYVGHANACIKCLWSRLGHKHGGLRTDGGRLV